MVFLLAVIFNNNFELNKRDTIAVTVELFEESEMSAIINLQLNIVIVENLETIELQQLHLHY